MQFRRWYLYGIFLAFFLVYLTIQSRAFLFAPWLVLPYSSDVISVSETTIIIHGSTSPQAELFVNDEEVSVSLRGDFSFPVSLSRGINAVKVKARNPFGRERVRALTIIVNTKG